MSGEFLPSFSLYSFFFFEVAGLVGGWRDSLLRRERALANEVFGELIQGFCGFCAGEFDIAFLLCEFHQLELGFSRAVGGGCVCVWVGKSMVTKKKKEPELHRV